MRDIIRTPLPLLAVALVLAAAGCRGDRTPRELARFAVDDTTGLLTTRNVDLDAAESSDGHGSLHFFAPGERVVNLYLVPTPDVSGPGDLVWSLDIRTVMLINALDAEVWLFPSDGEPRMVRDHLHKIIQTVDWTRREFRVPLRPKERIERVRLALHTNGMGHVWVDDMTLRYEPPAGR